MTNQEKKQWLKRYLPIVQEIDRLIDEKQLWAERATKISSSYSDMPKGGQTNKIQSAAAERDRIDRQIDEEYRKATSIRDEITLAINTIDDHEQRVLLKYRYIDGVKWWQIGEKLHCDTMTIWRKHGNALTRLQI